MKKTWAQKRDSAPPPHISTLEKTMFGLAPGTSLYISSPLEVQAYIAAIPAGETRSIGHMRDDLARKAGAQATCPMTASIFARIAAEAALAEGSSLPFWRLIDAKSPIAKKLSCGVDFIVARRLSEVA